MKKLDKGVVTDMAEQRKYNLGTYRVTGMGTTKPVLSYRTQGRFRIQKHGHQILAVRSIR